MVKPQPIVVFDVQRHYLTLLINNRVVMGTICTRTVRIILGVPKESFVRTNGERILQKQLFVNGQVFLIYLWICVCTPILFNWCWSQRLQFVNCVRGDINWSPNNPYLTPMDFSCEDLLYQEYTAAFRGLLVVQLEGNIRQKMAAVTKMPTNIDIP